MGEYFQVSRLLFKHWSETPRWHAKKTREEKLWQRQNSHFHFNSWPSLSPNVSKNFRCVQLFQMCQNISHVTKSIRNFHSYALHKYSNAKKKPTAKQIKSQIWLFNTPAWPSVRRSAKQSFIRVSDFINRHHPVAKTMSAGVSSLWVGSDTFSLHCTFSGGSRWAKVGHFGPKHAPV